jgi:hypothetical protein
MVYAPVGKRAAFVAGAGGNGMVVTRVKSKKAKSRQGRP